MVQVWPLLKSVYLPYLSPGNERVRKVSSFLYVVYVRKYKYVVQKITGRYKRSELTKKHIKRTIFAPIERVALHNMSNCTYTCLKGRAKRQYIVCTSSDYDLQVYVMKLSVLAYLQLIS